MKQIYESLAFALSNQAEWTWWAAKFPVAFQVEFNTNLLDCDASDTEHKKIAVGFYGLTSVNFLERGYCEKGWIYKFNSDEIESFKMSENTCVFNQSNKIEEIKKEASKITTVYGGEAHGISFKTSAIKFGFWAGNVGVLVGAKEMKIFGENGEIPFNKIKAKSIKKAVLA